MKNVIYKGRSTVQNGMFTTEFIVPRDINLQEGFGRISLYGVDDESDFTGYFDSIQVGGVDTTGLQDEDGPSLSLFLNDEEFVDGGITNSSPILLINVQDESGINVVGNGIGHDAILIIDNDNSNQINLNEYY